MYNFIQNQNFPSLSSNTPTFFYTTDFLLNFDSLESFMNI